MRGSRPVMAGVQPGAIGSLSEWRRRLGARAGRAGQRGVQGVVPVTVPVVAGHGQHDHLRVADLDAGHPFIQVREQRRILLPATPGRPPQCQYHINSGQQRNRRFISRHALSPRRWFPRGGQDQPTLRCIRPVPAIPEAANARVPVDDPKQLVLDVAGQVIGLPHESWLRDCGGTWRARGALTADVQPAVTCGQGQESRWPPGERGVSQCCLNLGALLTLAQNNARLINSEQYCA